MKGDPMLKIQSQRRNSSGEKNMNMIFFGLNCFASHRLPYCKSYSGRDEFFPHSKYYHIAVDAKQEIQSDTENSIEDKHVYLNFLSWTKFFVSHLMPFDTAYS